MRSIHHPLSIFVPLSAARLHSAGHLLGTCCLPARSPEPLMACQHLGSSCQAGAAPWLYCDILSGQLPVLWSSHPLNSSEFTI